MTLSWLLTVPLVFWSCSSKTTTARTGGSGEPENSSGNSDDAKVETQSSSQPVVISGVNVAEKCLKDCLSKQFTPVAVLSNSQKVTITARNYKNLGAIAAPEWKFSGSNIACESDGERAFSPTCSITDSGGGTIQVTVTLRTAQAPGGIVTAPTRSTFSSAAEGNGPTVYMILLGQIFDGRIVYTASTGPDGADYTCQTTLTTAANISTHKELKWFAAVTAPSQSLQQRIQLGTGRTDIIASESANDLQFRGPVMTLTGEIPNTTESLLVAGNTSFLSGLATRAKDPSAFLDGGTSASFGSLRSSSS